MAVERPTLHELWYRVAALRPRLRPQVQVVRQSFRGERWHVLRDPASMGVFRLDAGSWAFIGLLDGHRTVDAAWRAACDRQGDGAPTQAEALALLGQLAGANLLDARHAGDSAALFDRAAKRRRQTLGRTLSNPLFLRIPLWDPDRMLDRLLPHVGWLFGPFGVALWLLLMAASVVTLVGQADALLDGTRGVLAPANLPWLYAGTVLTKLVHELGHGIACKRFGRTEGTGGEVHTFGVMLLVLLPLPYVDATSAWSFRSKWRRAAVGAAGMYAELALAAGALFVFASSAEGSVAQALAFNMVFAAGVSSLLFNLNPLIRFDGYYILSDVAEQPNLMQRSQQSLLALIKRFGFGLSRVRSPAATAGEAVGLPLYGLASLAYRVVLLTTIVLFVAEQVPLAGVVFGVLGAIGLLLVPGLRAVDYLVTSPELGRKRARAVAAALLPVGALVALVALVPVPEHARAEGVAEPIEHASVAAPTDGWLAMRVQTGVDVRPDETVLAVAEDPALQAERVRLRARLREVRIRARLAQAEEVATAFALIDQIRALEGQLADVERRLAASTIRPPMAGVWLAADPNAATRGRFVRRGEPLGQVAVPGLWRVRIAADQRLGPRLVESGLATGDRVELRIAGGFGATLVGRIDGVVGGGRRELPSAALGMGGGGLLALSPADRSGRQAAEPYFEVLVSPVPGIDPAGVRFGQRVVARFELGRATLLDQGWRAAAQSLQSRFRF